MMKGNNLPDKVFGMDTRMFLLWLQPIGLALVLIFSLILVIVPKISEISGKMAEIKSVNNKIKEVNQKRNYLQMTDQEEIKNNALKLAMGLLPEKDAYLLVRIIRNVVGEANYAIDDFSISMGDIKSDNTAKKDTLNYDKIPVNVTLVGPMENYLNLIKLIERSLPVMSIESLEMNSSQDGVSLVKLGVSAYFLREITNLKIENISLADLTPSQEETNLLLKINEYKSMAVETNNEGGTFTKYERQDPFFTP